jgi:MFS family permease
VPQAKLSGVKFGSYSSLLGDVRWRKSALLGMVLCIAGVIGLWGIGFFSPELVGDVMERSLKAEGVAPEKIAGQKTYWIGVNSIVQNLGAFVGMLLMTKLAQRYGRKPAFAVAYVAALISTVGFFQFFDGRGDIWMSAVMGPASSRSSLALQSICRNSSPPVCAARARASATTWAASSRPAARSHSAVCKPRSKQVPRLPKLNWKPSARPAHI